MFVLRYVIITVIFLKSADCANILFIASVPTFSHNVFFRPIWKALADRGHKLTVLTTNPMEEPYPNIKEIDLNFVYERKAVITNLVWKFSNWPHILQTFKKMFRDVALLELNHPEVQNILRNETQHFDLIMAEMHIPLMFGFAHRFKCPLIGISSTDILTEHHEFLGNPTHPTLYPESFAAYADHTFVNRLLGFIFRLLKIFRYGIFEDDTTEILRTYFGPDTPSLKQLMKNISLVFLNVHPLFSLRPLGPRFITISGGTHIQKGRDLPKNLKEVMDNNPQGVVYFSLGTNVRNTQYPPNFVNTSIEAFKELPYEIIWKHDSELSNLPENIKVFKWIPQQDLLRHKNIKVFITQGGIHSIEEAIYAEVPMIGIPFMSDQNRNVHNLAVKSFGIALDKDTLTKEVFKRAIEEVATNPIYRNKVSKASSLMKDQPMTGLEKAVWYTEFIIRNKDVHDIYDNPHLGIPWYQYFFLDIIAVLLIASCVIFYLFYVILRILLVITRRLLLPIKKTKEE